MGDATNTIGVRSHLWFALVVFCIGVTAVLLPQLYGANLVPANAGSGTEGDPYTICASGCDYVSIAEAVGSDNTTTTAGDYFELQVGYDGTTESFPINFGSSSLNVSCANPNITIGSTTVAQPQINLSTTSTLSGCKIDFSSYTGAGLPAVGGQGGGGWNITNNTVLDVTFSIDSNVTINGNTVTLATSSGNLFNVQQDTGVTIRNNTINLNQTGDRSTQVLVNGFGTTTDFAFSTNTVNYGSSLSGYGGISHHGAGTGISVNGNIFAGWANPDSSPIGLRAATGRVEASVSFNTIKMTSSSDSEIRAIGLLNDGAGMAVTTTYNIIWFETLSSNSKGIYIQSQPNSMLYHDYLGIYNAATTVDDDGGATVTGGTNNRTTDPFFKTLNASSSDDNDLARFSDYLDVNGTTDIGAVAGSRSSGPFTLDDDCTVDYSSCHAVSSTALSAARTNDTWNVSAGTYGSFSITSSSLTLSNITIDGAGASTIFQAETVSSSAMTLTGITSSVIQDAVFQAASTTPLTTYTATNMIFDYNSNTYDDTAAIGFPADGYNFFITANCGSTGVFWNADATDVSADPNIGDDDYHIALINLSGALVTVHVPDSLASTAAEFDALSSCPAPDAWATSTFAVSNGVYSYSASSLSDSSITVASGYTDPPAISRTVTAYGGISLSDTSSITLSNVTSTANYYGIVLNGTTSGTQLNSSALQSSIGYDILSQTSGNSAFKNSSFTIASSSIDGVGEITVRYKARAFVQATSTDPIAGAVVNVLSADSSNSETLTTGSDGYSGLSDMLTAFLMTSSSIATNNGGFNPYSFTAQATSSYNLTVGSATLNSQNQTVTISMTTGVTSPNAVTNFATSSVATSSVAFSWTDNSSGFTQEDSLILDYITGTSTDDFPGTTSTIAQDSTATTVTGLAANTQYTFRIAAQNSVGTSAYATSSDFYTDAAIPLSPSATANGQTAVLITWSANGNSDSTVYQVYNNTDAEFVGITTDTQMIATRLTAGQSYSFKIRAQNLSDSSFSSFTSNVSATTDAVGSPVTITLSTASPSSTFKLGEGEDTHTATLDGVDGTTATTTISSLPSTSALTQGQSTTIDSDGDGTDDMQVTMGAVAASQATLTIATYTPGSTPVVSESTNTTVGGGTPVQTTPEVIAPTFSRLLVNGSEEATTNNTSVLVTFEGVNSAASEARVSTDPSFAGAGWASPYIAHTVLLPGVAGQYTLYGQVRSADGETSSVLVALVTYNPSLVDLPPSITSHSDQSVVDRLPFSVTGIGEPGATVAVSIAGTIYTVTADSTGAYGVSVLDQLVPGSYTISASQVLTDGRQSTARALTIWYAPPWHPVDLGDGIETGASFRTPDRPSGIVVPGESPTGDVRDQLVTIAQQRDAFLLVLQPETAQFYSSQIQAVPALPNKPIEIVMRPEGPVHSVTARLYDTAQKEHWVEGYLFEKDTNIQSFVADIEPPYPGEFVLVVTTNNEDGSRTHITKVIDSQEAGSVEELDPETGTETLPRAVVRLMAQGEDGEFQLWDGSLFEQDNPVFTGPEGMYAFQVPAGQYYLEISARGHDAHTSGIIVLSEPGTIAQDVVLARSESRWSQFWNSVFGLFQ